MVKYEKEAKHMKEETLGQRDRIVVFGCGGHARSIVNVLRERNEDIEIVLVDKNAHDDEIIMGCKAISDYKLRQNEGYIIAIGENRERENLYRILKNQYVGDCVSVISIYACIGRESQIGCGSFIAPNAYIGPLVKIGDNTIINTGSIIEHETIIGNNTHIAPNATVCGRARIGNNVFCGAGCTVIDKIKIGDNVTIGAGAVVIKDILEEGTYAGVPARKID